MREQELEMLQREKEAEHFKTWEEQEDNFHLQQAKLRYVGHLPLGPNTEPCLPQSLATRSFHCLGPSALVGPPGPSGGHPLRLSGANPHCAHRFLSTSFLEPVSAIESRAKETSEWSSLRVVLPHERAGC